MFETIWQISNIIISAVSLALAVWIYIKKRKIEKIQETEQYVSQSEKVDLEEKIRTYEHDIKRLQGVVEVLQGLPGKIAEVEEMLGPGTGTAKKYLVVSGTSAECLAKGQDISKEEISGYVEKILETPKKK